MVEVTSHERMMGNPAQDYMFNDEHADVGSQFKQESEYSESVGSEVNKGAAMDKMKKLA